MTKHKAETLNATLKEPEKRRLEQLEASQKNTSPRTQALPAEAEPLRRLVSVKDLMPTSWHVPVRRALSVHIVGFVSIMAVAAATSFGAGAAGLAAVAAAVVMGIGYRGLENLVHGASHRDILDGPGKVCRISRRTLNDAIGNAIAAIPVAQDVDAFRQTHLPDHHGGFGGEQDPCSSRMIEHPDVTAGGLPTFWGTLKRVPKETVNFYRTVGGKPRFAVRAIAWHATAMIAPAAMLVGLTAALIAWAAVFGITFSITLPTVRTLAESGEHDYSSNASRLSVLERTFAHDGFWNRLIHLFGDDKHPEHHLYPAVPQYRLGEVRRRMLVAGLGRFMKRRRSILGAVESFD